MPVEANQVLVSRYYQELWNGGNVTVADEIFAPTVSLYSVAYNGPQKLDRKSD